MTNTNQLKIVPFSSSIFPHCAAENCVRGVPLLFLRCRHAKKLEFHCILNRSGNGTSPKNLCCSSRMNISMAMIVYQETIVCCPVRQKGRVTSTASDEIHSVQTIATDMFFSARATAGQPIAGVELLVRYGISAESRTAVTRLSLIREIHVLRYVSRDFCDFQSVELCNDDALDSDILID